MTQGFPEDYHSGAYSTTNEGDDNDAASFAAHNYTSLPERCLINGCDFTSVDYTAPSVDISSGVVRVTDSDVSGLSKTWGDGAFVYEIDAQSGFTLTDGTLNELFVEVDTTTPDSASFTVTTDGTRPSGPSVKIGEVNTSNDTSSPQWNLLLEDGTFSYPNETAADTAATRFQSGTAVYDRTNDTYWRVS